MYLFSFLLFPAVLIYCINSRYIFAGDKKSLKEKILPGLFGVCCGIVLCAILEFFVSFSVYEGLNPLVFALREWCFLAVLPAIFFVLFIIWANDDWNYRIENFLAFMIPFYSVYTPFIVFSDMNGSSLFMIYIEPLMLLSMVFAAGFELRRFYENLKNKSARLILSVLLILIETFVPPAVKILYHYDYLWLLWFAAFLLYLVLCGTRCKSAIKYIIEDLRK